MMLNDHSGFGGGIDWQELLTSMRVLIISEAGAGKTYECRMQHKFLWEEGEPAFFIELSELAKSPLHDLLTADEEERFEAWRTARSGIATFFLDSIDELQLTLGSFKTALNKLSKPLRDQLNRARIVITTRPVPVDEHLIRANFPLTPMPEPVVEASAEAFADLVLGQEQPDTIESEDEGPPDWITVSLMPLSDDLIKQMAITQHIADPDALLDSIRRQNAQDFARRPQDLIELCADWRVSKKIRTHREQVQQNIQVKLKPRTDRQEAAELSPDRALEGASRLALAALLTRKLTIRHSLEADLGAASGSGSVALDPERVLPDWDRKEIRTLLERSLFGFASYGRVRFHHRSVTEYLAAQRLENRITHGMTMKAVKRLLLAETPEGIKVIKPSMRPLAGWLAASQESLFQEVRNREPEVLLTYGDPGSLTLSQRVDALRAYVGKYGSGGKRGMSIPSIQTYRFASRDLEDEVVRAWATGIENTEVRQLLIEMICAGNMSGCADLANFTAFNESAPDNERFEAIETLIHFSDSRLETLVQSLITQPERWGSNLCQRVATLLFPAHIAPVELCYLLDRIGVPQSPDIMQRRVFVNALKNAEVGHEYLQSLLDVLLAAIEGSVCWSAERIIYMSPRPDLVVLLGIVCRRLLSAGDTSYDVIRATILSFRIETRHMAEGNSKNELKAILTKASSELRAEIFWADYSFCQRLNPKSDPVARFGDAHHFGMFNLDADVDRDWIHAALADTHRPLFERQMMLAASLGVLCRGDEDVNAIVANLKPFIEDNPVLDACLMDIKRPVVQDPRADQIKRENAQQELQRQRSIEREHRRLVTIWHLLKESSETIFSPKREYRLLYFLWTVMRDRVRGGTASGWNRNFLESNFGRTVTDRIRHALVRIWRDAKPTLPVDMPEDKRNRVQTEWLLGAASVAADAETAGWAKHLTQHDAATAAHYILMELNGIPEWINELAKAHPHAIKDVLSKELSWELRDFGPTNVSGLLDTICFGAPSIAAVLLPSIKTWLVEHLERPQDPQYEQFAIGRLKRAVEVIISSDEPENIAFIRTIAIEQLQRKVPLKLQCLWVRVLFDIDPQAATHEMEQALSVMTSSAAAVELFASILGTRWADFVGEPGPRNFTADQYLRLVRLAYQHISPCDDLHRTRVYQANSRADAQTVRNRLLDGLLSCAGPDAWAAKLTLAADPLVVHMQDRLKRQAVEKAAQEIDQSVFTEVQLTVIDRFGEAPPVTRDEMFALMVDRLDDFDDVLVQDVSPRAVLALISEERVMRQCIALQLKTSANRLYTVDQEAVTADEKETDIRLRALSGQEAIIELKVGEKDWSGKVLRDTLRKQLVAKYMAAECCKSGCLMVTVASNRQWEHPDSGVKIDVDGLRAMLEAEAQVIMVEMGGAVLLYVKILDLRPRLAKENA